ncbi:YqjF family protein [Alienimonas sp. DA493]|uniref:YqjF family protein n=1 Tax=Alienimonas sp. DA493 TaxID=3373605 RepID=UPI00375433DF
MVLPPAAPPNDEIDRLALTARPAGRPAGYQSWRHLTFLHWRVEPEVVAKTLPAGLELDTHDGAAWIGLVPFLMTGVRPRWAPAVPGVSTFPETNVRTYVTRRNARGEREPGVFFYSLDAAKWLAVAIARTAWRLPYFRAAMTVTRDGDRTRYETRRLWPGPRGAGGLIEVAATGPAGAAAPGTLDHFLAERYLLFTPARGRILRGQVHHAPYPLRPARVERLSDSLVAAAGFPGLSGASQEAGRPPDHVRSSDGVDVEVFPLS